MVAFGGWPKVNLSKRVSVSISGVFLSVLSGSRLHPSLSEAGPAAMSPDRLVQRRCEIYRRYFPMTEVAVPADALRNHFVSKWAREQGIAVDVRSGRELGVAIAAGIQPRRLTVHAEGMRDSEIRATVALGPGCIVVSSLDGIDLLASAVGCRTQGVVVRVTDSNAPDLTLVGAQKTGRRTLRCDSEEMDAAIAAVLASARLDLVGLHCEVGRQADDFISYPAAIGQMITEMTHIRRIHGDVLTRLGLGGGRAMPSGDWCEELPELAEEIDESLDDACATMRFPRPLVVLSAGGAIVGRTRHDRPHARHPAVVVRSSFRATAAQ